MSWPWSELGLEGPSDSGEVKRAYAQRVKNVHPEEDPEGFQQLYAAYQTARRIARAAEEEARLLIAAQRAGEKQSFGFDTLPEEPASVQRFDYDALFAEAGRDTGPPPRTAVKPAAEEWDYEKLFAQADEERRQARAQQQTAEAGQEPKPRSAPPPLPWRKRVFREERAPLFLLWILLSLVFIDYFFLSGSSVPKGPEPGTISIEQRTAQNQNAAVTDADPEQQGLDAVRDLAIALAANDFPSLYAITHTGVAERDNGERFYWAQCTGQDGSGETLVMNYFLTVDGTRAYCISDEDNTGDSIYMESVGAMAAGGKSVSIYRCPE